MARVNVLKLNDALKNMYNAEKHHGICRSAMLLPSRQFGSIVSAGIMDHEEAMRKNVSSVHCLDYLCNARQHQNPAECELALLSALKSCSSLSSPSQGRQIHSLALKLGFHSSTFIQTSLINMYAKCGSICDARRLFDKMPERNLVTWNVMLNGYSKTGLVDMAKELFERIPDKDVISWGTMIDGYTQLDCVREALMMYRAMLRTGVEPNEVMIMNLISTCGRHTAIDDGRQLHGTVVKKGFDYNEFLQTTIISFYAACGMMDLASLQFDVGVKDYLKSWNALIAGFIKNGMTDQARQVFDEMPERDVFSWSTMISGYAHTEQPKMALEVFHKMVASGIKPNEVTMVSVFSAIATLGTLKEGRWAHDYISSECIPLNDNLRAALINMYAKCGSIDSALQFFNQIRDEVSSVTPWNAILCGLASHGYASMCLEVFSDLLRDHRPNPNTFIAVLSACCHAGLVGLGRRIFKSMKSTYNVEPDIKHYCCMIALFGKAGLFEEAEEIIRSMSMEADIVISR